MAQTYTDNDVNRLTINLLTKTEYNGLPSVSGTELYLVEEPLDDVPTEDSENPITSGGVYTALQGVKIPIGGIILYADTTAAPTGWLVCDGSAVSRTTYADLYDLIGDTYGSGDGSTTFNVPDLQTAAPIGAYIIRAI